MIIIESNKNIMKNPSILTHPVPLSITTAGFWLILYIKDIYQFQILFTGEYNSNYKDFILFRKLRNLEFLNSQFNYIRRNNYLLINEQDIEQNL